MGAHHGVTAGEVLGCRSLAIGLEAVLAGLGDIGLGRAVDAPQALQHALHGVRQSLVSGALAGKQGVPTKGRNLARQEHGTHGRCFQIGGVRVPDSAKIHLLVLQFFDFNDVRKAFEALHKRVLHGLTHGLSKGHELRQAQGLLAQKNDFVLQENIPDFSGKPLRNRLGQIHPRNFGTQCPCQAFDFHGDLPQSAVAPELLTTAAQVLMSARSIA